VLRRQLIPYAIIIIAFAFIYWLTMTVLYNSIPGYADLSWPDSMRKSRLLLQQEIFVYGLISALLVVNLLEIITVDSNNFLLRLLKSMLSILLVFFSCKGVYWLMGEPRVLNLFYYYRGTPAIITCVLCIVLMFFSLIIAELIQLTIFAFIPKEKITRLIPDCLKLEK